jgi:DNA topoisomerase-1
LDELDIPCPQCGSNLVVRKTKKGRKFFGCKNYPQCNYMTWDEPVKEKCPECGSTMIKKYSKAKGSWLVCTNEECKHEIQEKRENSGGKDNE